MSSLCTPVNKLTFKHENAWMGFFKISLAALQGLNDDVNFHWTKKDAGNPREFKKWMLAQQNNVEGQSWNNWKMHAHF